MNLEQAIHSHWADCPGLESLLPAERLTTGRTSGAAPPYATLELRAIHSQLPTNEGPATSETAFRIHVWHTGYDETRPIAEAIRTAFDGASLELAGFGGLARLNHVADSVRQHADGVWQWTLNFTARVSLL